MSINRLGHAVMHAHYALAMSTLSRVDLIMERARLRVDVLHSNYDSVRAITTIVPCW
jgi:hypothetical protein